MQERACRELAAERGIEVTHVFKDNDISAFSGKPRPAYQEMIERLANGEAKGIICWHPDRLYRRNRDLEPLIDFTDSHGIEILTVKAGDIDLTSRDGRTMARMVSVLATAEVERTTERILASERDRALRGQWRGGVVPYGYRKGEKKATLEVVEEDARAIRWVADQLLSGSILFRVARELNDRDMIKRRNGKPWNNTSVRGMLKAPAIAGLSVYKGEIVGKAQWEPILDEDTWRAVNAILNEPSRRKHQGTERRWQGSGVYECGKCGGFMRTQRQRPGADKWIYLCRECQSVARLQHLVDMVVDETIIAYFSQEENRLEVLSSQESEGESVADLMEERRVILARSAEAGLLFADGVISADAFRVSEARTREKVELLDRRLEAARKVSPVANMLLEEGDIAEKWGRMSADNRAGLIRRFMRVVIMPARRGNWKFDPSLIRIEWR